MEKLESQQTIMGIILHGGNARSCVMRSITEAKNGNFIKADKLMAEATEELSKAHIMQTELIQSEARGESTEISLLLIHAQDHLMNSITVKELSEEIIHLTKKTIHL